MERTYVLHAITHMHMHTRVIYKHRKFLNVFIMGWSVRSIAARETHPFLLF